MNRTTPLWLACALAFPLTAAAADEQARASVYQLELIVFRNYPISDSERLLPLPPRSLISAEDGQTDSANLGEAIESGSIGTGADAFQVNGQTELFGSEANFGPKSADGRPVFKAYDDGIDLGSGRPGNTLTTGRWPLTSPEDFMLGDVFARMDKAYGYRILWHGAATLPMERQRVYHFGLQTDSLDDGRWALEAQLQFRLSRFMHMNATVVLTDLTGPADDSGSVVSEDVSADYEEKAVFQQAIATAMAENPDQVMTIALAPNAPVYGRYIMQQSRRMKSGQLHYLDHPAIGILAMIQSVDETGKNDKTAEQSFDDGESELDDYSPEEQAD